MYGQKISCQLDNHWHGVVVWEIIWRHQQIDIMLSPFSATLAEPIRLGGLRATGSRIRRRGVGQVKRE
eukprot:3284845-Pyramimonas_sp.AAC.1